MLTTSTAIVIGFLCMAFFGAGFMTMIYRRLNKAKGVECLTNDLQQDRKVEFSHLGVDSPLFR